MCIRDSDYAGTQACLALKEEGYEVIPVSYTHLDVYKRQWLGYSWKEYDIQKHKGVVSLYMNDERFKKYYDAEQEGCAEFLLNAVMFWSGKFN